MSKPKEYYVSHGGYFAHLDTESKIVQIHSHSGKCELVCKAVWHNYTITSPGVTFPPNVRLELSKALVEVMHS